MKIVVAANDSLKEELSAQGLSEAAEIVWLQEITTLPGTDVFIDLCFINDPARVSKLKKLSASLIIINAVNQTLHELPGNFIRINGWPTFLKRQITEASGTDNVMRAAAEKAFSFFNKSIEWVPDITGFISTRVVSMIINEAYFTLQDKVSSKEEIDTAMKLGTNYPYGPFEWSKKIGLKNVYELLSKLATENKRYEPAALLKIEAI